MMNRFRAFMAGRRGADALSIILMILAVALDMIAQANAGKAISTVLSVLAFLLMAFVVYRIFSKKKPGQSNRFFDKLKTEFVGWRMRCQQSGEYKFFTCPGCRNHLRVPRGKGKIQITCPKCGQRFGGKS